jgi:hypothetical protein
VYVEKSRANNPLHTDFNPVTAPQKEEKNKRFFKENA